MRLMLTGQVEGKIGNALLFAEADQFLLGEDVSTRCLGDLQRCHHGLTVSMWVRVTELQSQDLVAPVLDTGYHGLRVFHNDSQLVVNATAGMRCWTVRIYTMFRKKHPLTFSSISLRVMCRFKQKLQ